MAVMQKSAAAEPTHAQKIHTEIVERTAIDFSIAVSRSLLGDVVATRKFVRDITTVRAAVTASLLTEKTTKPAFGLPKGP